MKQGSVHRAIAAVAVVGLYLGFLFSAPSLSVLGTPGEYASLHLLLEMFSISIAMMVVAISWYGLSQRRFMASNTMIFCYLVVFASDIGHSVFYSGMPFLVAEPGPDRAIFFWFSARVFETLAVLLIAMRLPLPGGRLLWLALGLLCAAGISSLGIFGLESLPAFFVPGKGVTPLKVWIEYGFMAANALLALWLFRSSVEEESSKFRYLAWSALLMALSSLAFSRYQHVTDLANLSGHLVKIAAYAFVLVAILKAGIGEPYAKLAASEESLRSAEEELRSLLEQLPVGIARLDRRGRYLYVNKVHAESLKRSPEDVIGCSIDELIGEPRLDQARRHLALAYQGLATDYSLSYKTAAGEDGFLHVRLVPDLMQGGGVPGALAIFVDVTETMKAKALADESMREVADLKAALDAHAIVAVTDAKGVITRVNEKFCTISQYGRDELIGSTHKVINSGHHDRAFFQDLWQTISRGEVWNGEVCNRAKDGSLYWVHTTIVPLLGADGRPAQYIAIRADITKRVQAEQEAIRMALHDFLTGLPNRRLMIERLNRLHEGCRRKSTHAAILMLDLDNFKEINDTLGHAAGDQLLKQVGNRLLRVARADDTVSRLGGDEFALLLAGLGDEAVSAGEVASLLAERVRTALTEPYLLAGQAVSVSASIGVVMVSEGSPGTDELMKQADLALYKSKEMGRNAVSFFDPALQADLVARAEMFRDLRQAMERSEFELHYQPVVDRDRRTLGVEALLRWRHPARGMVSPGMFIPIAESHGLISEIGHWVLREACRQLAEWAADPVKSEWTVAVNVSARQLNESDFVARVEEALSANGASPTRLRLEITESMLQDNLEQTIGKMVSLRRLGIRFALDDFGTGYSSLSYLKRMPIDQLKIDRSFVADVESDANDAAIARTILSLAASLEIHVVAEGVENETQFAFLVAHGCESFQGYLFSRPVPAARLS